MDERALSFDVVALPPVTPLIRYARERGKTVITGSEVFAIRAVERICPLCGIRPDDALFQPRLVTSVTFFPFSLN